MSNNFRFKNPAAKIIKTDSDKKLDHIRDLLRANINIDLLRETFVSFKSRSGVTSYIIVMSDFLLEVKAKSKETYGDRQHQIIATAKSVVILQYIKMLLQIRLDPPIFSFCEW